MDSDLGGANGFFYVCRDGILSVYREQYPFYVFTLVSSSFVFFCIFRVFYVCILLHEPLFVSSHHPHSPYTAYRIALLAAAMVIYPMAGVSMECVPMECVSPSFLLQGKASTASTTRDGIGNGRSANDGAAYATYGIGFRRFIIGLGVGPV